MPYLHDKWTPLKKKTLGVWPNLEPQIELNRKREAELAKLKEEYENGALNHESALANLRQKHNAVIGDLSDQIDALNKAKAK